MNGDAQRIASHTLDATGLTPFDYLFLSDLHLGADLVAHLRPWATSSWLTQEPEIDLQLERFLAHHQRLRRPTRRLCLVIVGDFLDLVGVSLPLDAVRTTPTREEQRHGLGSPPDHVVQKVWAIAQRHGRAFRALCQFLAAGNSLMLVRGNHDVELHWRAAQQAFAQAISSHGHDEPTRARVRTAITICPWFFKVDGLFYVEHGHEFDVMCSYGEPLLPTCPWDSRRIRAVPFSVMLREVARPTRGLSTQAYENVGFGAYLRLLYKLGITGSLGIGLRFARAVRRLLGDWLGHAVRRSRRRMHRAALRRRRFAARMNVQETRLASLQRLYARPAATGLCTVLHSLYVDRIVASLLAGASVVAGALLAARFAQVENGILCALPAALLGCYGAIGIARDISPEARMQASAATIARMFRTRWVLMGHTHRPGQTDLGPSATYVNLGHWGQDDVPEERPAEDAACPCTFFLLEGHPGGYRGRFMRWDAQRGALPFAAEQAAEAAANAKPCMGRASAAAR